MRERITTSGGNVFVDLGFSKEEAAVLAMRAELMARLRSVIDERGWTQQEAAKLLGIGQSRVSDLVRGKWEKFSLDMLVTLAARAGQKPGLVLKAA
jgi:predicted XRE-type DNA-binding protein